LDNGKSIEVRVNDRGPFADNRIIDVSRTVARLLDFEDAGTANVKVDYIGPAPLDGDDTKTLLASYKDPGNTPAGSISPVLVASTQPLRAPVAPAALVSIAPPLSHSQPAAQGVAFSPAPPNPRPAPAVSTDPIAPLILRSGLSYADPAPAASLTPAQQAAEQLAQADLSSQLAIAAAKKAAQLAAASARTGASP
jgi:rare lipoprotein A